MCSLGFRKKLISDKLCMVSFSLTSPSFTKSFRIIFEIVEALLMISIVDGHVVHQDFDLAAAKNQIEIPSRLVGFLDKSIHRLLQGRHLKKNIADTPRPNLLADTPLHQTNDCIVDTPLDSKPSRGHPNTQSFKPTCWLDLFT